MAPEAAINGGTQCADDDKQYLFIIRHGERVDAANPGWKELETSRTGDCPLSALGHQQGQEVGKYIDSWMYDRGLGANDITWLSSPFLRCLQTSDEALNSFQKVDLGKLAINPEYSIFEWDGHFGEWHRDLPTLEERKHYFPRLSMSYESLFMPELPEPTSKFYERCQKSVDLFHLRHQYKGRQIFVMVSHAAACIALAKTFTKLNTTDITPAGPCSFYILTRTSNTEVWSIDAHDDLEGYNGFTGHLSDMGSVTVPWNNFGDGKTKFYTGPPTSHFAPKVKNDS